MALFVVLLAGCGPTSPTTRTTASAHPSKASPSPTPLFAFPVASGVSCPDLAALGLERALLNASDQNHPDRRDVILCDARDAAHPRTLQALVGSSNQQFLSRALIGVVA